MPGSFFAMFRRRDNQEERVGECDDQGSLYVVAGNGGLLGTVNIDDTPFTAVVGGVQPAEAIQLGASDGAGLQRLLCTTAGILRTTPEATELHLGEVSGPTVRTPKVTPTVTAGGYTAKDAVGGLLTFTNAVRLSGGSGTIHAVTIIDNAAANAELVLVLFDRTFTATADNAPFDPSDADLQNSIGKIKIGTAYYDSFNDNSTACMTGIGLPIKLLGTSLFGQLMCTTNGTPTYAATNDLTIIVHILPD